jgi:hypothetical protein
MNRDEMSILYRGSSIDASYQVLVHLVKWFQRRRFLEIHQSETRIACGASETAWPSESKLGRKHPWKVLFKDAHLVPIR